MSIQTATELVYSLVKKTYIKTTQIHDTFSHTHINIHWPSLYMLMIRAQPLGSLTSNDQLHYLKIYTSYVNSSTLGSPLTFNDQVPFKVMHHTPKSFYSSIYPSTFYSSTFGLQFLPMLM